MPLGGAGRLAELLLLIPALAVGAGAVAQVDLADTGQLPDGFWIGSRSAPPPLWSRISPCASRPVLGSGPAARHRRAQRTRSCAHPSARRRRRRARQGTRLSGPASFAEHQVIWSALGVVLFIGVLVVVRELRTLARLTYTAMLVGLVLLLLPLAPHIGRNINGARIWIRVGGLSFQPGEVAKLGADRLLRRLSRVQA